MTTETRLPFDRVHLQSHRLSRPRTRLGQGPRERTRERHCRHHLLGRGHGRHGQSRCQETRPAYVFTIALSRSSSDEWSCYIGTCAKCGSLSSQELCQACALLESLNKGLAKIDLREVRPTPRNALATCQLTAMGPWSPPPRFLRRGLLLPRPINHRDRHRQWSPRRTIELLTGWYTVYIFIHADGAVRGDVVGSV
jgi:hypothetical protein